jgi:zinc D-Ala-D-Ala carboxypeptidase
VDKFKDNKTIPLIFLAVAGLLITTIQGYKLAQFSANEKIQKGYEEQFRISKEAEAKALLKTYLTGKFEPSTRKNFALVPSSYTILGPVYLRKETFEAFQKMEAAARLDGIELKLASATRNFNYQKGLWEKKWTGDALVEGKNLAVSIPEGRERFQKILEYSAAPGTSRHHWGTDIDLNYAVPEYFESGKGKLEYEWLRENARKFGFCQVYNEKNQLRPAGYNEEKWHWSYLPLARQLTQDYKKNITEADLGGFLGAEYISELNLIDDYVLGINPECL